MDCQASEIGCYTKDVVLLWISRDKVDILNLSVVGIDKFDGLRDKGYRPILEAGCQRRGDCLTISPNL